jgi:hypothetical protein
MKFELSPEQIKKLNEWCATKDLEVYTGSIGGRFSYIFTDTSLGTVTRVKDNLDSTEIDLSDYENW